MPHRQRSAIAIRLAAAIEVEALPLVGANEDLLDSKAALIAFVCALADQLLGCSGPKFEDVLNSIPQMIADYDVEPTTALAAARDRLVRRLRSECVRCGAGSTGVCQVSVSGSDARSRVKGPCISEILALMESVEDRVRQIHEAYTNLPQARLKFSIHRADRAATQGLFDEFNVNGWTDVQADRESATVGLEIKDRAFDWPTLCQTLYVFAHEMICHAFHGLRGPQRENTDDRCSWSEGWMDALAWTITEAWIEREIGAMPEWLQIDSARVRDACHSLHSRRYRPGVLDTLHMERRIHAKSAFHKLRQALDVPSDRPRPGHTRAAEFSIRLNLCRLDAPARDHIVTLLSMGLLESPPVRFESVVGVCSDFCEHEDPQRLLADLSESMYGMQH